MGQIRRPPSMALNLIWSPGAPPSWCSLCLETTSQDVSPRDFPTRDLGPRRFGDHTWGCPTDSALDFGTYPVWLAPWISLNINVDILEVADLAVSLVALYPCVTLLSCDCSFPCFVLCQCLQLPHTCLECSVLRKHWMLGRQRRIPG